MTSVLFVCLGMHLSLNKGNICRSPMAEAVFSDIVKKHGLDSRIKRIDSAGTAGYHIGDFPDTRTIDVCKEHGVPIDHVGRQICNGDFEAFDWILVMDQVREIHQLFKENLRNVERVKPVNSKAKVQLFGDFDPEGDKIIKDPYYGGSSGFERNFQQV